jgi:hypothetical protein
MPQWSPVGKTGKTGTWLGVTDLDHLRIGSGVAAAVGIREMSSSRSM